MMSQDVVSEEKAVRIMDDYDVLELARKIDREIKIKEPLFSNVYSKVAKVDEGFYITPRLEIAVASIKHLRERGISVIEFPDVYTAGLLHENSHAIAFPFMTRMNLTYAVVHEYCKQRGIDFNVHIFNEVENILSDIFNELILYTHRVAEYQTLPKLRYLYIYKSSVKKIEGWLKQREQLESNPVNAIFTVHNLVFSSIYRGKLSSPKIPKPKWLSEHVYNTLYNAAKRFNVEEHIYGVNTGVFSQWIKTLVFEAGLYENIDKFYMLVKDTISKNKLSFSHDEARKIRGLLQFPNDKILSPYWTYYTVLTAYYRLTIESPRDALNKLFQMLPDMNIDKGSNSRPAPPPPEILSSIMNQSAYEILSPELAEYASKRLISVALLTKKQMFIASSRSGVVKIPWYRRPRGKIDPRSLLKPSILDWRVQVTQQIPEYRKVSVSATSIPDNITIVIDESGSTGELSPVLAPILGIDTSVYDVERVTAMALLYNVMRFSDKIPTQMVRFSSNTDIVSGTVADIYNWLKNVDSSKIMWGGTEIELAVEEGLKIHKDKPTNYFLLMTDMEISGEQAHAIKELLLENLRRSPILILGANADIPKPLLELNRYHNIAVVSVKTLNDYPKLEQAIKKLASLLK